MVVAVTYLLMARTGFLARAVRNLSRAFRVYDPASTDIYSARYIICGIWQVQAVSLLILLQTALIWVVLDVLAYFAVAKFIGIHLPRGRHDRHCLRRCLGLAIPAAPSALGTFPRGSRFRVPDPGQAGR